MQPPPIFSRSLMSTVVIILALWSVNPATSMIAEWIDKDVFHIAGEEKEEKSRSQPQCDGKNWFREAG